MISRRKVLRQLANLPVVGGFLGGLGTDVGSELAPSDAPDDEYRDYFNELGLRTFINAHGTITALSGSRMPPEVRDAWNYATHHYVNLDAIQDKAGDRIADLIGCEYATVTAGAFSAMTLGLAGVMSGQDQEKVQQLPDTTGLKNEVIVLKPPHPVGYVHALKNTGATLIEVETREELEDAITENTAMLFVMNAYNGSSVEKEELVAVGKEHDIPTFNDCAADVPPKKRLWQYTDMGFDLVAFSGGKGLRGPQSAGLLLGREDLIRAARLHAPPRGNTIGRGMKVNKEEVLAMMVAVERYLELDHEAQWARWKSQIEFIQSTVEAVDGVDTEYYVPDIANHVPSLRITWDQDRVEITPAEADQKLKQGHPSIETGGGSESLNVATWMMGQEEVRTVAYSIRDVLEDAAA
ncbi:MAG: aminotransferase class V-fold PLP-dependent enzyme [Salinibacter sp.]|uniref:aminotransferase class V-fold PLP-dependent enzyme n=1 Tax=Salinibacter sp. TaxID=2065818 RepID=UPI002FC35B29